MEKDMEGSGRGLICRCYPGIRLEELRQNTKNLSQDSRFPGRNLNPGRPEYELGAYSGLTAAYVIPHIPHPFWRLFLSKFSIRLSVFLSAHLGSFRTARGISIHAQ
jgi:hypothetical protein